MAKTIGTFNKEGKGGAWRTVGIPTHDVTHPIEGGHGRPLLRLRIRYMTLPVDVSEHPREHDRIWVPRQEDRRAIVDEGPIVRILWIEYRLDGPVFVAVVSHEAS
jgi:hypothetical protein